MTAPVIIQDEYTIQEQRMPLVLPSEYKTVKDLPIPLDDSVEVKEMSEKVFAVYYLLLWLSHRIKVFKTMRSHFGKFVELTVHSSE